MSAEDHKSIKEIDRELAEQAEALEKRIEEAEAKHLPPGSDAPGDAAADDAVKPPAKGD